MTTIEGKVDHLHKCVEDWADTLTERVTRIETEAATARQTMERAEQDRYRMHQENVRKHDTLTERLDRLIERRAFAGP